MWVVVQICLMLPLLHGTLGCSEQLAARCADGSVCVPASRRRRSARSYCAPCRAGQYAAGSTCVPCPSGTWSTGPSIVCQGSPCMPGRYGAVGQVHADASVCVACKAGKFQPLSGAGMCLQCPAGTRRAANATATAGYTMCKGKPCAVGRYGRKHQSGCSACPKSTVAVFPGSYACMRCKVGFFPDANHTVCTKSPVCGSFKAPPDCRLRHSGIYWLVALAFVLGILNFCGMCSSGGLHGLLALVSMGIAIGFTMPGPALSDVVFYFILGILVCGQIAVIAIK